MLRGGTREERGGTREERGRGRWGRSLLIFIFPYDMHAFNQYYSFMNIQDNRV